MVFKYYHVRSKYINCNENYRVMSGDDIQIN